MKVKARVCALAAVAVVGCGGERTSADTNRLEEVAAIGAAVMPFDLDATTHVFEKTPEGGLQQVVSDTNDPEQILLIRQHLQEEATRFASGDFHDPAMIHGEEMPGLHDLVMGHERLAIEYGELPDGAQIRYSSGDPELVTALHMWFDAQLADHGQHAQAHR